MGDQTNGRIEEAFQLLPKKARATHGLSQKNIAARVGCTQSRISKLESITDTDLRLGDLAKHADAVGLRVKIILESKEPHPANRVKELAFRVG